jgi:hypothetical protein
MRFRDDAYILTEGPIDLKRSSFNPYFNSAGRSAMPDLCSRRGRTGRIALVGSEAEPHERADARAH